MSDACTDPQGHRLNIAGYCVRCGSFVPLTATLRHHAEGLAAALELVEFTKRSRGPARCPCCNGVTHTIGCVLAAALSAWREGPGAETKGGGNG